MVEYHPARVRDLANKDPRLRLLWTEHTAFEQRLQALNSYRFLTPTEQMERRNLQKLKLARKDDMARILAGYNKSG